MNAATVTEHLALTTDVKPDVSWVAFIIIGGVAGWLAGKIVKGRGSGILMDIVIGVLGAFGAGVVAANLFHTNVSAGGHWFTFFIALIGAVVLLWLLRLIRKPKT